MLTPLSLSSYTVTNALGCGVDRSLSALREGRGGLQSWRVDEDGFETWIGKVEGLEDYRVISELSRYDCRNNRLAELGLEQDGFADQVRQARERYGAHRVGVFIGTSTSGIKQAEEAYLRRDPESGLLPSDFDFHRTHNLFSVTDFVSQYLGLTGPAFTISTACSSSAKVFASAYRYIASGLCDAAVVGGVDSLCLTTLYGFRSLELVSDQPCMPWDLNRKGINIGEAAGFALLESSRINPEAVALLGYGESSDAYHMSTPHPDGAGAAMAMKRALLSAEMDVSEVDYINLHGTATPANDAAEGKGIESVFGDTVACSSTKGWTGHTLGAAGITEAIFACLSIEHGLMPATLNLKEMDPKLGVAVLTQPIDKPVKRAMNNSFGFGGSNCSLLFGRPE